MRLASNRPLRLMASTDRRPALRRSGERTCTRSRTGDHDPDREHDLGGGRPVGRPDRTGGRRLVGNVFTVTVPDWLSFIGSFAGVVLTFLAGAEVDVPQFRREWRASLSIGARLVRRAVRGRRRRRLLAIGWNRDQAEIGGLALSTTSLAVVYAVLVETGLNRSMIGKRIMSATFVTDILTVIGLSILFITPNYLDRAVRRRLDRC